jgi:hypothetical protein
MFLIYRLVDTGAGVVWGGGPGGVRTAGDTAGGELPAALIATTENWYSVSGRSPLRVAVAVGAVTITGGPLGVGVTR